MHTYRMYYKILIAFFQIYILNYVWEFTLSAHTFFLDMLLLHVDSVYLQQSAHL